MENIVRLPSVDEIKGFNKFKTRKDGIADITYFANINCYNSIMEEERIKKIFGINITKSEDFKNYGSHYHRTVYGFYTMNVTILGQPIVVFGSKRMNITNINNDIYNSSDNRLWGIRPVINYTEEVKKNITKETEVSPGVFIVEFGRYPQKIVFSKELEYTDICRKKMYGTLKKTGRTYCSNKNCYSISSSKGVKFKFEPEICEEYEVNGEYYVSCKDYWFKVEPIRWYLNKKNNTLLSVSILQTGIPYFLSKTEDRSYDSSFMKLFLEKYLYHDIFQEITDIKNKDESITTKQDKVQSIVNEITEYSKHSHKKEEIISKISEIIKEYKKSIQELKNNNTLVLKTEEGIYLELITKLTALLNKVKAYYDSNTTYFNILEIIDNCISILEGKEISNKDNDNDSNNNELEKDFKNIKNIVIPFLGKEDKTINEIKLLLNSEKEKVTNFLNNGLNLENVELRIDKQEELYKDVNDFELTLRSKLMPILIEINNRVNQKDLVNEINTSINDTINRIPIIAKNKITKIYLEEINKEVLKIQELTNTSISKIELNKILDFDIDYENSTEEIIKKLQKILISLYKLETTLTKENLLNNKLDDYEKIINIKIKKL